MHLEGKKLLSVKDFSELTGIEESTLRYWDRIGLFCPAMRHEENNYRLYAIEQMVAVNFVTTLSKLKLPLKTIGQARDARDPQKIIALLEQQDLEIDKEMIHLQEIHSTIHMLRTMYRRGAEATPGTICVQHFKQMAIIMGPPNAYSNGEQLYRALMEYYKQAKHNRVNVSNPIGGYYTSLEQYTENPVLPYCFFSIDTTGCDYLPEGDYLVSYVQGYYGQMGTLPEQMAVYAREHGLACEGPVYAIYLLDEICIRDPAEYLAQVSVRVRKRKNYYVT
jgi:DNA-binding transcriptional MerR regulator